MDEEFHPGDAPLPARPIHTDPTWITPAFHALGYKDEKKVRCGCHRLYRTVEQIGKHFDLHHKGSVHDSNGARSPHRKVSESDSFQSSHRAAHEGAFSSDAIVTGLDGLKVNAR